MTGKGRRGVRTRGGHSWSWPGHAVSTSGHATSTVPPLTSTTDLLRAVSTYDPNFFAPPSSIPQVRPPQAPETSFQSMPHPGVSYQFGQPAGPSFHSMPLGGYHPQPSAPVTSFQALLAQGLAPLMVPTPSMLPPSLPSAYPSSSSCVPSASPSTCPSSSTRSGSGTPVPETQENSSPSVTTTKQKGRKKRTTKTVPLPGGVGLLDGHNRLIIKPVGDGFLPSDQAVKHVTASMSPHFTQGWPTWGKVPPEIRDLMFQEFKNKCSWDAEYNNKVRMNFEKKAAQRLSDGFFRFRKYGTVPSWIYDQNWAMLKSYWESEEFITLSEQNKKNRASSKGGSLHTSGSVSLATHRARYEAEHGKTSDIEFYRLFHNVCDNDGNISKWVEPRAQQVDEKYKALYEEWVESQGSVDGDPKPTPEEEEAMFIEAVGGYTSKNRAYGLGPSRYKEPSRIGIVNSYASSSIDNDNVNPAVQAQLDEMKEKMVQQENEMKEKMVQQENERKEMERKLADQAEKMAKFEAWFSTYGPRSDSQRRE